MTDLQQLEQDRHRLNWMIQNHGRVEFEFSGDDVMKEIDKAMESSK